MTIFLEGAKITRLLQMGRRISFLKGAIFNTLNGCETTSNWLPISAALIREETAARPNSINNVKYLSCLSL